MYLLGDVGYRSPRFATTCSTDQTRQACILTPPTPLFGFGQAVGLPTEVGEPADPFATPLEILPEWFLLPSFEILRAVPNKLLGISGMVLIPVGLASVPWLEASNPFANPLRRGSGTWLFVVGLVSHRNTSRLFQEWQCQTL